MVVSIDGCLTVDQDGREIAPGRVRELRSTGCGPADPQHELGLLGDAQHLAEQLTARGDLGRLAQRGGGQACSGGGEQDSAERLARSQPIFWPVLGRCENEERGGIVG